MGNNPNPALAAFLESFTAERDWAQILVRRSGNGFELRHAADREVETLRDLPLAELRKLSLVNAAGQFRPLKSAPDLQRGWRLYCRDHEELWRGLQELYPGSLPDWYALANGAQPTDYRDFTNRQTGMYRITQLHSNEQAAQVISACCPPHLCLKQRLWTVAGLERDAAERKSVIPCLEPCAVLLELARKSARIEQEEKIELEMPASDWETMMAAVQQLIDHPPAGMRSGDMASPVNPRRLQLVLEKHRSKALRPKPDE